MKNYSSSIKQILIAPNAFKGSLKAQEFCQILSEELQLPGYAIKSYPMCDGGDGTAAIIASYWKAKSFVFSTIDALGRNHDVTYYIYEKTAILDLATICGIQHLKPHEYDIYNATTAGLGKLLLHLAQQDINQIILGIGGSASIDGGLGALVEMGLKIKKRDNRYNNLLIDLENIDSFELKNNFNHIQWTILCDVDNLLCGPEGAAFTFGPQKGATPAQIQLLDQKLYQYAHMLETEKLENVLSLKHGGAAGGIAAAFHTLLKAKLISGADYCLHLSHLESQIPNAHCVITGEGKLDSQSIKGKLPGVLSILCQKYDTPLIGIAGAIEPPLPHFEQLYSFMDYTSDLSDAINRPQFYLRLIAKDLKRKLLKLL